MRLNIKYSLKIVVSVVLISIIFWSVEYGIILRTLSMISPYVILAVFLINTLGISIAALKWKLLLPSARFLTLLRFTLVGQFYALALPGQFTGEVAKAYRLGTDTGNMKTVGASVLMDRVTGLIGLLLVALFGLLYSNTALPSMYQNAMLLFVGLGLLSLFAAQLRVVRTMLGALLARIFRTRGAKVKTAVEEFFTAYGALARNGKLMFMSIALGILFQLLAVSITAFLAPSLGLSVAFVDWLWIFGVISIAVLLPVTIGGLGLREGAFAGILLWLGQDPASAIALSLSIFALQLCFGVLGGLFEWRTHLSKK